MRSQSIEHVKKSHFFLINSIFFIITLLYITSLSEVYGDSGTTAFTFTNVTCTEGIGHVLLIGQFNNNGTFYKVIFLKMFIHDRNGQVLATGSGNISDIKPHQTKIFHAITRFSGDFSSCIVQVDNAIQK